MVRGSGSRDDVQVGFLHRFEMLQKMKLFVKVRVKYHDGYFKCSYLTNDDVPPWCFPFIITSVQREGLHSALELLAPSGKMSF